MPINNIGIYIYIYVCTRNTFYCYRHIKLRDKSLPSRVIQQICTVIISIYMKFMEKKTVQNMYAKSEYTIYRTKAYA